jgi:hypothetical protein
MGTVHDKVFDVLLEVTSRNNKIVNSKFLIPLKYARTQSVSQKESNQNVEYKKQREKKCLVKFYRLSQLYILLVIQSL